jgi:hypothetical protein
VNNIAFKRFFMDTETVKVKEIEVFEIADYTTLPADVQKCAIGRLFQERARGGGGRLRADQDRWN